MKAKVRFTKPVRRGLVTFRGLLVDTLHNEDSAPARTQVARMKGRAARDFNAAMAWLESIEDALAPAAEPEAVQA